MENDEKGAENTIILPEKAKIDEKTAVVVSSPNFDSRHLSLQANVKRILEAREVKKEIKTSALIDQNLINEVDLETLLSKDDNLFYQEKKRLYLEAYPELRDSPFDLDDLHLMIMEQIIQRNLLKRKKKHPLAQIEDEYTDSVKRQGDFKKSLSLRRTDRVKQNEPKKVTVNIAQLGLVLQNENELSRKQAIMNSELEEERLLLASKPQEVVE